MTHHRPAPGTTAAIDRLRQRTVDDELLLDEMDRLRARNADLEETVRLLRVQLPLMPYALGPNPAGPDPRWAARIPEQRPPQDGYSSSQSAPISGSTSVKPQPVAQLRSVCPPQEQGRNSSG